MTINNFAHAVSRRRFMPPPTNLGQYAAAEGLAAAAMSASDVKVVPLNIVFIVEVEGLIAKLMSRPQAEMLITVNTEAEGRGVNERLIPKPSR